MHPFALFGLHAGESQSRSDLQIIDESKQTTEENKRVCTKVTQLWQSLPHFQLTTHTHSGDAAAVCSNKRTCIPLHGPPAGAVSSELCNPIVTPDI